MRQLSVLLLAALLSVSARAAEISLPQNFSLLATQPATRFDSHKINLPAGTHQLLIRFETVIPARSNSENDTLVRSEPQVLRLVLAEDTRLTLRATVPTQEAALRAYARTPRFELVDERGEAHAFVQDELKLTGFVFNPDFAALLADYNRDGGQAGIQPTRSFRPNVVGSEDTAPVQAGEVEAALQQLFLRATPEQRKRFMSWAVQQL